jgi:NTP pyrophosphatase (non-canonical NTP hydrolase)
MSGMVNTKTATLDELAMAVLAWADERGLMDPDNAFGQMLKVTEEVGELAGSIAKHKREAQKDAIGDVLVTVLILAVQLGFSSTECLAHAYNEIANRTGKTVDGVFIKDEGL